MEMEIESHVHKTSVAVVESSGGRRKQMTGWKSLSADIMTACGYGFELCRLFFPDTNCCPLWQGRNVAVLVVVNIS